MTAELVQAHGRKWAGTLTVVQLPATGRVWNNGMFQCNRMTPAAPASATGVRSLVRRPQ